MNGSDAGCAASVRSPNAASARGLDNPGFASPVGLVAMAKGRSNTEMADELFISENTVKTHVKRVMTKLGARDRVNAVVIAYEGGLMDE